MACSNNSGVSRSGPGAVQIVSELETVQQLILDRVTPDADEDENELFSLAALLVIVAHRVLVLAQSGLHPSSQAPNGLTHWQQLKSGFFEAADLLYQAIVADANSRGSTVAQSTNAARPGCGLSQPASLTCPYCNSMIPASIAARVSDTGELPSVKVRVNFQGQPNDGPNKCPTCHRPTKTRLLIAADGQESSLGVTVALDRENQTAAETKRMIEITTQRLKAAAENLLVLNNRSPVLDADTVSLIVRCIQSAMLLLVTVGNGSFRMSFWMTPDAFGSTMVDEVGGFLKDNIGRIIQIP